LRNQRLLRQLSGKRGQRGSSGCWLGQSSGKSAQVLCGHGGELLQSRIHQNVSVIKKHALVVRSSLVADVFALHLRLTIIGERAVGSAGIVEECHLYLHRASVTRVAGELES